MTAARQPPDALQAARSLHSIEVELPDGWKVQRIITELGLRRIAAVLDAFAAEAVAAERERCAKIAENPGFIQAQDTEWDMGVEYAKPFIAAAIRSFTTEASS